jgi:hypothetical protein
MARLSRNLVSDPRAAVEFSSAAHVVQCARCGHACPVDAWHKLPRQRTLTHLDVMSYVSDWPPDVIVEVRSCAGCGEPIARSCVSLTPGH